jgi:hypothetical protein
VRPTPDPRPLPCVHGTGGGLGDWEVANYPGRVAPPHRSTALPALALTLAGFVVVVAGGWVVGLLRAPGAGGAGV